MKATPKLLIASSDQSPDLIYATRFFVPDPCVLLEVRGRRTLILSDLELDRGRAVARVDEVLSLSELEKPLKTKANPNPPLAAVVARFLRSRKIRKVRVPSDFPLGLARELTRRRIGLQPVAGLFYPEREIKSEEELRHLTKSIRLAEKGLARAMEILRSSKPDRRGQLRWAGKPLTSERLRGEMEAAVVLHGGQVSNTIVAGGLQACDPHERGSGPLHGNQLIILDIFPRDPETGYFGDLTRTVVRGRASEAQRRLWETVRKAQARVVKSIRPGVSGADLHQETVEAFEKAGYPTELRDGRRVGFFHGTGHGLGLELHEAPRFAKAVFRPGQVFTVEPGLYYPEIGGVRIEDDVVVTGDSARTLNRFPKELEL